MRLIFISAVSGVGKTTTCDYIKNNHLLEDYDVFDIDDLENVNNYDNDTYNIFYENAIKKAVDKAGNKNIIIGSCINPTDIEKINVLKSIESVEMILITCSNSELEKRLRSRDKNRNCSSDDFIKGQIDYQNYMLKHLELYKLHLDNTNKSVKSISNENMDYLQNGIKKEKWEKAKKWMRVQKVYHRRASTAWLRFI